MRERRLKYFGHLRGEATWEAVRVVMEINVYKREKERKDEEEMDR